MRREVDRERLGAFLRSLGEAAREPGVVYLTGGATALLFGWRGSTVDVDLKLEPESDALFRALPRLKEAHEINVEIASPDAFIPELPGWRERSPFVSREGLLTIRHYDLHAQALAKIERGHTRDTADVLEMLRRGLVAPAALRSYFEEIFPRLYRFPAIDPPGFRKALEQALRPFEEAGG